mgnify:CR=1 FL=1
MMKNRFVVFLCMLGLVLGSAVFVAADEHGSGEKMEKAAEGKTAEEGKECADKQAKSDEKKTEATEKKAEGAGKQTEAAVTEMKEEKPAAVSEGGVQGLVVMESEIASAVEDRQPVDAKTEFAQGVDKVYCWTKIGNVDYPTQVEHRWKKGDEILAEVSLKVGGSGWRVYSSKSIAEDWTGDFSVEIVDGDKVIETLPFTVTEQASESEETAMPEETGGEGEAEE